MNYAELKDILMDSMDRILKIETIRGGKNI